VRKTLQAVEALADAREGVDEPREQLRVGEPLPARCLPEDMMRIFGIKAARFYALQAAGKFDRFEIRPRIGRRAWSGRKIQRYLDGETFGAVGA
jgi:hypothetical protein